MSRIGDGDGGPGSKSPGVGPWPDEAASRVRNVRRAITSEMNGESVDTEVAPLLPDLLTRLDNLSETEKGADAPAPTPPEEVSPPSPGAEMALLRRAESELRETISAREGRERDEAIREMLEVLGRYRSLREEVMMRTGL